MASHLIKLRLFVPDPDSVFCLVASGPVLIFVVALIRVVFAACLQHNFAGFRRESKRWSRQSPLHPCRFSPSVRLGFSRANIVEDHKRVTRIRPILVCSGLKSELFLWCCNIFITENLSVGVLAAVPQFSVQSRYYFIYILHRFEVIWIFKKLNHISHLSSHGVQVGILIISLN